MLVGLYLAEVFRDWDNLLFISREPCECSAEDWPETVQIRIRDENEGFLHENTLYEVASYVNAHLSLGGKPAKAANGYVQMSRKLAVECLFKLLYFDGAQGLHYEMGEQLTSLDPPVLRDVLNHCLGNGSAEFTRTNSERFKTLYDARVDAATRSGQKLPRPQVFAIYRARRNGNLPGK